MAKTADKDGIYTRTDETTGETLRFYVAKGDPIPEGTTFGTMDVPDDPDAPQTKATKGGAEKATATGPSETR